MIQLIISLVTIGLLAILFQFVVLPWVGEKIELLNFGFFTRLLMSLLLATITSKAILD